MINKYISLSHVIQDGMPAYPGDIIPSLKQTANAERDGYTLSEIHSGFHVGTHVDAPIHMVAGGKYIDEFDPNDFIGPGKIIDVRGKPVIDVVDLPAAPFKKGEIILFFTGFSDHFGQDIYYQDHPVITEELAKHLVLSGVKMVGFDTPSPDKPPFRIHQILLENSILIIENLTKLHLLLSIQSFDIIAAPPPFRAEGAWVNVLAVETK